MRGALSLNLAATVAVVLAASSGAGWAKIPDGDWQTINRDLASTRYSPLDQINQSNVASLKLAWSYPMRSAGTTVPLVVGSVMYFPAGARIVALDADTGKEVWTYTLPKDAPPTAIPPRRPARRRSRPFRLAAWATGRATPRRARVCS